MRSWRVVLGVVVLAAGGAACSASSPVMTADPAPAPPAAAGPVLGVGDSVMLGAAGALGAAIPGIAVDAAVSRQFGTGVEVVAGRAAAGALPPTVVVHLGTNGTVTAGQCDGLMGAAYGSRVVLVTLKVPRSWEAGNNEVIRSCAARHGQRVADWAAVSAGRPDLFARDGYHLTAAGAQVYAQLVAATLAA